VTPTSPLAPRFQTDEWAAKRDKVNADLARLAQQQAQERKDSKGAPDPMTQTDARKDAK
jgi:hypothetical protein